MANLWHRRRAVGGVSGGSSFICADESYGYRGGQLLTTISNGDAGRLSRFVYNLYYGALQRDPTSQELSDEINQLATAGAQGQAQLYSTAGIFTTPTSTVDQMILVLRSGPPMPPAECRIGSMC